jgi:WD40 repeat protein
MKNSLSWEIPFLYKISILSQDQTLKGRVVSLLTNKTTLLPVLNFNEKLYNKFRNLNPNIFHRFFSINPKTFQLVYSQGLIGGGSCIPRHKYIDLDNFYTDHELSILRENQEIAMDICRKISDQTKTGEIEMKDIDDLSKISATKCEKPVFIADMILENFSKDSFSLDSKYFVFREKLMSIARKFLLADFLNYKSNYAHTSEYNETSKQIIELVLVRIKENDELMIESTTYIEAQTVSRLLTKNKFLQSWKKKILEDRKDLIRMLLNLKNSNPKECILRAINYYNSLPKELKGLVFTYMVLFDQIEKDLPGLENGEKSEVILAFLTKEINKRLLYISNEAKIILIDFIEFCIFQEHLPNSFYFNFIEKIRVLCKSKDILIRAKCARIQDSLRKIDVIKPRADQIHQNMLSVEKNTFIIKILNDSRGIILEMSKMDENQEFVSKRDISSSLKVLPLLTGSLESGRISSKSGKGLEIILEGHESFVNCVAFTSDNKYIVSGSWDETIRIWNMIEKKEEGILEGHTSGVTSLAITTDNKYIISAGDKTIRIWNFEERKQESVLKGHTDPVRAVAVTSDRKYIVSTGLDKTVRIWNLQTRLEEAVLEGHSDYVTCISITSDDKYAVSGSVDKSLRVWNLKKRTQKVALRGHIWDVDCVATSSDGVYIVSGSVDKTVRLWDLKLKKQVTVFEGHTGTVNSVAITIDCKYAISACDDNTIRVWNLAVKTIEVIIPGHQNLVTCVRITENNNFIVSTSYDKTIRIWNLLDVILNKTN